MYNTDKDTCSKVKIQLKPKYDGQTNVVRSVLSNFAIILLMERERES